MGGLFDRFFLAPREKASFTACEVRILIGVFHRIFLPLDTREGETSDG